MARLKRVHGPNSNRCVHARRGRHHRTRNLGCFEKPSSISDSHDKWIQCRDVVGHTGDVLGSYGSIRKLIKEGKYGNYKFSARVEPVDIPNPVLKFFWSDSYGKQIKSTTSRIYRLLEKKAAKFIPPEAKEELDEGLSPSNTGPIEWQVFVFKKTAIPRRAWTNKSRNRRAGQAPLEGVDIG